MLGSLRLTSGYYRSAYAAWAEVPGSQLYHGNQQRYLKTVTDYAVSQGMHVVLGLHSYPGGGEYTRLRHVGIEEYHLTRTCLAHSQLARYR
jgi:aryl-phospho-beta-D-glucosidase BglC (GH1 family)